MIKRIAVGLLISVISFLLLRYNEWVIRQTGSWYWAEKYLGSEGGTRLMLKLICVFALIIGLLVITGLHVRFIRWLLAPLLRVPLT